MAFEDFDEMNIDSYEIGVKLTLIKEDMLFVLSPKSFYEKYEVLKALYMQNQDERVTNSANGNIMVYL